MRLPGWLRGGAGSHSETTEGEKKDAGTLRESSERARRERLAQARRDREARARTDLVAKAGSKERGRKDAGSRRGKAAAERGARRRTSASAGASEPDPSRSGSRSGGGSGDTWRTRAGELGAGLATALKQGADETRGRAKGAAPGFATGLLRLAAMLFGIFFDLLAVVLNVAIAAATFVAGPVGRVLLAVRTVLTWASRWLTPARALALVAAAALVLLALSQFADYRSISIGTDNYADGIQTVAPAPETGREAAGSAHAYLLVPIAAAGLLLLGLALRGRWRLCRLIALLGVAAIVLSLVHDRPTGLDSTAQAATYEGVRATLLGGFYAQLFSGLLLTVSSLLLGRELRVAAESTSSRPARRSQPRGASRRRLLRRNPPVEGARA